MAPPSMPQQIVGYARNKLGQQVGDGECFALVDHALRHAGAKSASDFKDLSDEDYEWGTPIELAVAAPGDIIQFRDIKLVKKWTTVETLSHGRTKTTTHERTLTFGHHSAIVLRNDGNGVVTVLQQHVRPKGQIVHSMQLDFNERAQGRIWVYRPVPK